MTWDPPEHAYPNKQQPIHVGLSNWVQLSIKCTVHSLSQQALTVLHGWSFATFKSSSHYIADKYNRNSSYIADTSAASWTHHNLKQRINWVQQPIKCTILCLPQETSMVLHGWSSLIPSQPKLYTIDIANLSTAKILGKITQNQRWFESEDERLHLNQGHNHLN